MNQHDRWWTFARLESRLALDGRWFLTGGYKCWSAGYGETPIDSEKKRKEALARP